MGWNPFAWVGRLFGGRKAKRRTLAVEAVRVASAPLSPLALASAALTPDAATATETAPVSVAIVSAEDRAAAAIAAADLVDTPTIVFAALGVEAMLDPVAPPVAIDDAAAPTLAAVADEGPGAALAAEIIAAAEVLRSVIPARLPEIELRAVEDLLDTAAEALSGMPRRRRARPVLPLSSRIGAVKAAARPVKMVSAPRPKRLENAAAGAPKQQRKRGGDLPRRTPPTRSVWIDTPAPIADSRGGQAAAARRAAA